MTTYDASIFVCPHTEWHVQPIATRYPVVTSKGTFVQWFCPVCDSSHRPRTDAAYRPSEPGVHVTAVSPDATPHERSSRYDS